MCYSLEVSVFFMVLDFVLAFYLWRRDIGTDRLWMIFTIFPGIVQLGDLAMWYEKRFDPDFEKQSCSRFNQIWTGIQTIWVASQPVWCYIGAIHYRYHKLGVKWPVTSLSDVLISLVPAQTVIWLVLWRVHQIDFNPCLTENPGIYYCSHLTEDNHWIWSWGRDQWGTGLCSREDSKFFFGVPWTRDDPAFYARENREHDYPFFSQALSSLIWCFPLRHAYPNGAGVIILLYAIIVSLLAMQTTSYGNMWCFLANSAGFVGIINPYILRFLGYDAATIDPKWDSAAVRKQQ